MSIVRALALAAALSLGTAGGALAADALKLPAEPESRPEAMLDKLVDQLITTLQGLLQAIPQYELPEINEHGDIIIRRKRPDDGSDLPAGESEAVET